MAKYLRLPIEVEAIQFVGGEKSRKLVEEFVDEDSIYDWVKAAGPERITIFNGIDYNTCVEGDWIIKRVNGEFYPCTDSIFKTIYSEVK